MSETRRSFEDWRDEYDDVRPIYESFVDRLAALLRVLVEDEVAPSISTYGHAVSTYEFGDLLYRLARQGSTFANPLDEVTEFARVFVVGNDLEDVGGICAIVEQEFDVFGDRSVTLDQARARAAAMISGNAGALRYDGPRYVVALDGARAALPEWKAFAGLRAEIRVLTELQNAARYLDEYILPYYSDDSYPPQIRQLVGGALAAIAAADDDLARVSSELDEIDSRYELAVARADLETELDANAVAAYLRVSETVSALVETAVEAGFRQPSEREIDPRDAEDTLLWLLRREGFRTLGDVDQFLRNAEERAPSIFGQIAQLAGERGFTPWALEDSLVEWLVLVLRRLNLETVLLMRYYDDIDYALNTLIGNPVADAEA